MHRAIMFLCFIMGMTAFLSLTGCSGSGSSGNNGGVITTQMGGARQGNALLLNGQTETFAGSALTGSQDGIGSAARFNYPYGVTTDGTNLYVLDTRNHTIRRVVKATGAVTTLAGTAGLSGATDGIGSAARFNYPSGITTDGTSLFVADGDNYTIRKVVIATGEVTTLAGSAGVSGSTDGTGSTALFSYSSGITTDGTNLFVADRSNNTIRKVVITTGEVTTLAGSAGVTGSTDGTGSAARFSSPSGVTNDGTCLYVMDGNNCTIRKVVIATSEVTTLAGRAGMSGATDGVGSTARFSYSASIATDGVNLYVADGGNNTIRKVVIATGEVTTLAGRAGVEGGATDAIGSAARFNSPCGICADGTSLFVSDGFNYSIRKIEIASGAVTTIAGNSASIGSADGTGSAARFRTPNGITTDGTNLYVADTGNLTIRKVVIATGAVTTLAGSAGVSGATDGIGSVARFNYISGITTDGTNLYVVDTGNNTIRKVVIATGAVTTLAGSAGLSGSTDGTGSAARFYYPYGITTDGTNLYVADSGNCTIRKVVITTGAVTTLAGSAGLSGSTDGTGSATRFYYPNDITTDGTNLYVADTGNLTIRKMVIANGTVTTIAGSAGLIGAADGTGGAARFKSPIKITTDGTNLYIADTDNYTIRKVVIATGAVTTLAGSAGVLGATEGSGSAARFFFPSGVTTNGTSLFVIDSCNNTIRSIR